MKKQTNAIDILIMLQNWNATDQMGTVTTKKEKNMKKFALKKQGLNLPLSGLSQNVTFSHLLLGRVLITTY